MKILFLTESYYPKPSPNAICVSKLMHILLKQGAVCRLITLKNIYRQQNEEVIDGINVRRVNNNLGTRLIYFCQSKRWIPRHPIYRIVLSLNRLHGALLGFWWPLLAPLAVLRYYRAGKEEYKKGRVDVVVGVYKQIEAVLAGILLRKKYPDLKFIVYTLDAMSGSILPRILRSNSIALKSTKRWERICFTYADSICVMASHKGHYSQHEYDAYRMKIKYMDIPLVDLNIEQQEVLSASSTSKIRFVFTGSMHHTTANPEYFLKIFELLNRSGVDASFHIYGNISSEIKKCLEANELFESRIFIYGRVPHDEVVKIQNSADILLNFGNSYPCTIPCKIFEYISLRKSILSFYKIDDDASRSYLEKYPDAILIKEDDDSLRANMELLKLFVSHNISKTKSKLDLDDIFYENTPYPMADEIRNIIDRS